MRPVTGKLETAVSFTNPPPVHSEFKQAWVGPMTTVYIILGGLKPMTEQRSTQWQNRISFTSTTMVPALSNRVQKHFCTLCLFPLTTPLFSNEQSCRIGFERDVMFEYQANLGSSQIFKYLGKVLDIYMCCGSKSNTEVRIRGISFSFWFF